ncbi:MAG: hypothetical protein JWM34_3983 [Ilumatobacteraceae bacterium]|nr:hypothetical protein [Ilumatobacteraceae bacterium]
MSRFGYAPWTFAGGAAAVVAATIGLVPSVGRAANEPPTRRLVESSDCGSRVGSTTTSTAPPRSGADTSQSISVVVPRVAMLHVDASGTVTAAATNTGCAPSPSDEVYVFQADGTLRRTMSVDVSTVRWTGDFTHPGVYQPQT